MRFVKSPWASLRAICSLHLRHFDVPVVSGGGGLLSVKVALFLELFIKINIILLYMDNGLPEKSIGLADKGRYNLIIWLDLNTICRMANARHSSSWREQLPHLDESCSLVVEQ